MSSEEQRGEYSLENRTWKGWHSLSNGLHNYLMTLRSDLHLQRWCGEYVSPSFISTAARLYPELHTAAVYRLTNNKKHLKGFVIWANGCVADVDFQGELYTRKESDPRYHIRLSDSSEIMAWCVGEHRAGLMAMKHVLDATRGRTLVTESHDSRMQNLYQEQGFEPVYIRSVSPDDEGQDHVRWKRYEDTWALVRAGSP
jgi:hypothetical protein